MRVGTPYIVVAVAFLCFALPLQPATAQSEISVEPDTLILRNETDVVVRNIIDDPVQIDSLRFSTLSIESGWTLNLESKDTTIISLYFVAGTLYERSVFPRILLAPRDSAIIQFDHYDRCVVCKRGSTSENIDTLFIYTDVSGDEPHQVILDYTDFTVSTEDEPGVQLASIDVYPSPAAHAAEVEIRFKEAAVASVQVFDLLGREVPMPLEETGISRQHSFRIDVSGWAPGLYVLRVQGHAGGRTSEIGARPIMVAR